jgi:hypothetical protein
MKLLLEFKDYNELSFIKDTVEDIVLSEIEESIVPVIHQSIIAINDNQITCHDLKRSEYSSDDLEFRSYLVSFNGRIEKEEFDSISPRIESILSLEFDEKIKCMSLQSFPINEFVICNDVEFRTLESICEFELYFEEEIYEMKDNEYASELEISIDSVEDNKSITIWINKFLKKIGLSIILIRDKYNKEKNILTYEITHSFFLNTARTISDRWLKYINPDRLYSQASTDIDTRNWIQKNLPSEKSALQDLRDINNKMKELKLSFELNLDTDLNLESKRLLNLIRKEVFPLFSTDETRSISELFKEFNKLEDFQIEADWQHQGNYFYLFDINYKSEHYIIHVKYDVKKDLVHVELKDKKIFDEVPINEFSQTIYLILQEN